MFKKLLAGATLLCAATAANAGTIEQTIDVAASPTNFNTTVAFDQFDDMGGTLELLSVTFSIDGFVQGSARVESLDGSESVIETTLEATISLTDALMNTLVVTIPSITNIFNASADDGTLDFGGTSGITYDDLSASQFNSETYTDAMVLAYFTGVGVEMADFDATATSSASGAGNIVSQFASSAGGQVKVIYEYAQVPVSAPTHVALLGLGLLAFAGYRKARK